MATTHAPSASISAISSDTSSRPLTSLPSINTNLATTAATTTAAIAANPVHQTPVTATANDLAQLDVRSTPRPEVNVTDHSVKASDKTLGLSPRAAAIPLTGAAVMAEVKRRQKQQQYQQQRERSKTPISSRQTSPNPAVAAMQSLMGVSGISKPTDAPAPNNLSEPLRVAAEKIQIPPESNASVDSEQVSPTSLGSFGTLEHTSSGQSLTATANDVGSSSSHYVAEPGQMEQGMGFTVHNGHLAAAANQDGSKAFSYPGPPQPEPGQEGGPTRGMSLPGYGQSSPNSPATGKRHKCPHCSTDFTRHHNLKSHLLTHSQEKPYVCSTCQARFRRLHDLKRHTKLHTGERPHTCDKCGRRFARGDALARHNKGPGGCAGRRSSFGGEDDYGPDGTGDGMDGLDYTGGEDDDETGTPSRRGSEPSRKRRQLETPHDSSREVYQAHGSTYPPAQHERLRGEMGPPTVIHPGSNAAGSPRQPSPAGVPINSNSNNNNGANSHTTNNNAYYASGQVFAEPGMMTQSPKPLSPGLAPDQHRLSVADASGSGHMGRNRSTSLTTQFQQAHFGRGSSAGGRTPPPPGGPFANNPQPPAGSILPPLGASSTNSHAHGRPSHAGNNMMTGVMHAGPPPPASTTTVGHIPGSNQGSASSHGRSSGSSSMRDVPGHEHALQADIWAYARSIEQRFGRMQDEYELRLSRQQEEIISLKNQMAQLIGSYSSDMGGGQRGPPPYPS